MDLGIKGRLAVVTGGSSGLGLASAKALAAEGARILLFSRSEEKLKEAVKVIRSEFGVEVEYVAGDLRRREDIERLFSRARELGGSDILVYSTGGPKPGGFFDLGWDDWEEAYRLLASSAIWAARLAAKQMIEKGWGRMVFVGSVTLIRPWPNLALSNIMRMPIAGLVRTLALELAPYGITVNAVLPSVIMTDRVKRLAEDLARREGISFDDAVKRLVARVPMGRPGKPEELGAVVAFLSSEKASFITGALIPVDGGASVK
ncbi:MAG: SDR family oxidoreductase [Desulfurococcales archaeon]|nr:SDR family oxidoreductase [Desulfurococcales archaeon]